MRLEHLGTHRPWGHGPLVMLVVGEKKTVKKGGKNQKFFTTFASFLWVVPLRMEIRECHGSSDSEGHSPALIPLFIKRWVLLCKMNGTLDLSWRNDAPVRGEEPCVLLSRFSNDSESLNFRVHLASQIIKLTSNSKTPINNVPWLFPFVFAPSPLPRTTPFMQDRLWSVIFLTCMSHIR